MVSRLKHAGRGAQSRRDRARGDRAGGVSDCVPLLRHGGDRVFGDQILPAFQKIFDDFHTSLPTPTIKLIQALVLAGHFQVIGFAVLGVLLAILLFTLARYIGIIEWDPPLLRRFALPLEGATVLRWLADAVDGQRPLSTAVGTLARKHPKLYMRRQLHLASQRISDGADWCDSLAETGLVPRVEAGVLKAAQRVGNLPWALDDMADRLARRFTARLTGLLSIGFPVVLLMFAAVVFLVVVGMFIPLANLVAHLS